MHYLVTSETYNQFDIFDTPHLHRNIYNQSSYPLLQQIFHMVYLSDHIQDTKPLYIHKTPYLYEFLNQIPYHKF